MNWNELTKTFGRGVIVVLPIAVTAYLIWWIAWGIEGVMKSIGSVLPLSVYYPGMGLVTAVLLVFAVGLVMKSTLGKKLWLVTESMFERIPLVKSLYGSLRDLMDFFSGKKSDGMSQVVMIDLDGTGRQRLIGFVMRESFDDLPAGIGDAEHVAVYMPMSYQLGGFTTIVPRSAIKPIDMSIEQAMRFALTAGVKKEEAKPG
jgi:uncharacterized membrane protein